MLRIRRHLWGEGQSQDTWGVWSRQLPRVKMCESECDNTFSCILIKVYLHYHHLRCSGYIKGLLKKPRQSIGLQILTPLTTAGDQRVKWLQAAVWRRKQQTSELRVLDEQRSHGRLTVRIGGTKARTKSLKSFLFFLGAYLSGARSNRVRKLQQPTERLTRWYGLHHPAGGGASEGTPLGSADGLFQAVNTMRSSPELINPSVNTMWAHDTTSRSDEAQWFKTVSKVILLSDY